MSFVLFALLVQDSDMQFPVVVILLDPTVLRNEPRTPDVLDAICKKCDGTFLFVNDFRDAVRLVQDPNVHLLVSYYENKNKRLYETCSPVLFPFPKIKWIHLDYFPTDADTFNRIINDAYANMCTLPVPMRHLSRPLFSVFTTCFRSFEKIRRVYQSLKMQVLQNWEWVVIDDSNDPAHFAFLKRELLGETEEGAEVGVGMVDRRIRLFCGANNNGSIGNMKNTAVGMCRGKYVLEMDHDDEVLPHVLSDAYTAFEDNPDTMFVYMDCANVHESVVRVPVTENNRALFWLGDEICKGYGAYYLQKVGAGKENGLCANKWVFVYNTPNINNITLSHLVCCPNHPRMWNRERLMEVGSYCEHLPICDDYEVLMRSMVAENAGIIKIDKLGYIQYMNDGDNNFSIIRNAEINRIGPRFLQPFGFHNFETVKVMEERGAREDDVWYRTNTPMWKRGEEYVHKYCNKRLRSGTREQVFVFRARTFVELMQQGCRQLLYETDDGRDVFLLETEGDHGLLMKTIDEWNLGHYVRGYVLPNATDMEALMYIKHCMRVLPMSQVRIYGFPEEWIAKHFRTENVDADAVPSSSSSSSSHVPVSELEPESEIQSTQTPPLSPPPPPRMHQRSRLFANKARKGRKPLRQPNAFRVV